MQLRLSVCQILMNLIQLRSLFIADLSERVVFRLELIVRTTSDLIFELSNLAPGCR